ncbi:MAG: hypothetical protein WCR74_19460, partial [Betaproteobacteria bacterium]
MRVLRPAWPAPLPHPGRHRSPLALTPAPLQPGRPVLRAPAPELPLALALAPAPLVPGRPAPLVPALELPLALAQPRAPQAREAAAAVVV